MTVSAHSHQQHNHTLKETDLLHQLRWRYATKQFDPARKINSDTWAALEESLVLSPSSFGLQPWKFYVIDKPELRTQLKSASWNQSQITDASHLVVLTSRTTLDAQDVQRLLNRITEVRNIPMASLEGYKQMMLGSINARTPEQLADWSRRQAYIALGVLLTSAAFLGVDTCPIEGLDPAEYDKILNLANTGYHTVCAAVLGYRANTDKYAALAKVRYAKSEVISHV